MEIILTICLEQYPPWIKHTGIDNRLVIRSQTRTCILKNLKRVSGYDKNQQKDHP